MSESSFPLHPSERGEAMNDLVEQALRTEIERLCAENELLHAENELLRDEKGCRILDQETEIDRLQAQAGEMQLSLFNRDAQIKQFKDDIEYMRIEIERLRALHRPATMRCADMIIRDKDTEIGRLRAELQTVHAHLNHMRNLKRAKAGEKT